MTRPRYRRAPRRLAGRCSRRPRAHGVPPVRARRATSAASLISAARAASAVVDHAPISTTLQDASTAQGQPFGSVAGAGGHGCRVGPVVAHRPGVGAPVPPGRGLSSRSTLPLSASSSSRSASAGRHRAEPAQAQPSGARARPRAPTSPASVTRPRFEPPAADSTRPRVDDRRREGGGPGSPAASPGATGR